MTTMDDSEEKLRRAAKLYAEKDGESLIAESSGICAQNVSQITPRADKVVKRILAKEKRKKWRKALIGVCAAAACVVVYLLLTTVAPGNEAPPLDVPLPADFVVYDSVFDNGASVYHLKSETHGDVTLTIGDESGADGVVSGEGSGVGSANGDATSAGSAANSDEYAGYDEVLIDGASVPAKVQGASKSLAFKYEGLSYTLSCDGDFGPLAAFYRNIVVPGHPEGYYDPGFEYIGK